MATRRPKHPGGRPAIWGEREPFTVRPPVDVTTALKAEAARLGVPSMPEFAAITLAEQVGVQLPSSADGKQLQLAFDESLIPEPPHEVILFANRAAPQPWGQRSPFNVRVPVRVKPLLEAAASEQRIPLAEWCVLVLAKRVGIDLPVRRRDDDDEDRPALALGA